MMRWGKGIRQFSASILVALITATFGITEHQPVTALNDAADSATQFQLRGSVIAPRFLFGHMAPSFFVLGAQKSGTSALWNLITQHPQIEKPTQKETLFFNNDCHQLFCSKPGNIAQGEDYDKKQVCGKIGPRSTQLEKYMNFFVKSSATKTGGQLTGESSATYLGCSCCVDTIYDLFPRARHSFRSIQCLNCAGSCPTMTCRTGEQRQQKLSALVMSFNLLWFCIFQRLGKAT